MAWAEETRIKDEDQGRIKIRKMIQRKSGMGKGLEKEVTYLLARYNKVNK